MKAKLSLKLAATLLALTTLLYQPSTGFGQSTAFTYQGRLDAVGTPANATPSAVRQTYRGTGEIAHEVLPPLQALTPTLNLRPLTFNPTKP